MRWLAAPIALSCGVAIAACPEPPQPSPPPKAPALGSESLAASALSGPGAPIHAARVPIVPSSSPTIATPSVSATWDPSCPPCEKSLSDVDCKRCGGHWDVGMFGADCACPTFDGNKVCRDSSECAHGCEIPYETALGIAGTTCDAQGCVGPAASTGLPLGRCAPHWTTFGCRGFLVREQTSKGVRRKAYWKCTD